MEPDLGSAIEPNANRRPRRATRFNTGIAFVPCTACTRECFGDAPVVRDRILAFRSVEAGFSF